MATVQTLVTDTLILINVVDAGGSPSASESNHALAALNRLLSSWSAAGVPVYQTTRATVSLTGAASYSLVTRPIKIKAATVVAGGVSKDLEIVTEKRFASYTDRTRTGKFGKILYCDYGYPTATARILPIPATGGSLELFTIQALAQYSALSDNIDLPPGYEQALQFALAVAVAPSYGRPVSKDVLAGALEAKEAIAKLNADVLGASEPAATADAAPAE